MLKEFSNIFKYMMGECSAGFQQEKCGSCPVQNQVNNSGKLDPVQEIKTHVGIHREYTSHQVVL